MSDANVKMKVEGVDATGKAFNSAEKRAKATSMRIRAALGGALAAAGAFLSLRAVKSGIDNLSHLSDIAMKSGTSLEELTRTALAFQVAGLDIPVDRLARSFQYLERTTGKTGMGAFMDAVRTIAAVEDPAKRGAELVKTFGRSGLELQPLINGGEEVISKFATLAALMPSISSAAADAGDEMADALLVFGRGAQSLGLKVVGYLCRLFGDVFPGGVRAGALNAVNWFDYALQKMFNRLTAWGTKIGQMGQALGNFLFNDYSWEQAWSEYKELSEIADRQLDARLQDIEKKRADFKNLLSSVDADELANVFSRSGGASAGALNIPAAASSPRYSSNRLIEAGSNESMRLAILGPQLQNETKRQTSLLERIVENTKKTAENTDESMSEGEDYGIVD